MLKTLTVAIPTYNRADELHRQLAWAFDDLHGYESECEVIVSDNASTDQTSQVCAQWQQAFAKRGVAFRANSNSQNIGPMPNIALCFDRANGRFVWVVGDDDPIPRGKVAWVIETLRREPELASIVLNYQSVGKTAFNESFHFNADQLGDGRQVMEQVLRQNLNGLGFMSAQIYRTEYVREARHFWPDAPQNYDSQIFTSAYVGSRGRALATRDTHLTYVTGNNIYEKNKRIGLTLSVDTLEVLKHLRRAGFDGKLCRELAWRHVLGVKRRFVSCALRVNPLVTAVQLTRAGWYLTLLSFA